MPPRMTPVSAEAAESVKSASGQIQDKDPPPKNVTGKQQTFK